MHVAIDFGSQTLQQYLIVVGVIMGICLVDIRREGREVRRESVGMRGTENIDRLVKSGWGTG